MKKSTRIVKRLLALFLVVLMSIESFGALVSDNDGSAFITKAEFDSLRSNFQTQINNYNTALDNKIDGAIASYLAGISVKNEPYIYLDRIKSSIGSDLRFYNTYPVGTDLTTQYVVNKEKSYSLNYRSSEEDQLKSLDGTAFKTKYSGSAKRAIGVDGNQNFTFNVVFWAGNTKLATYTIPQGKRYGFVFLGGNSGSTNYTVKIGYNSNENKPSMANASIGSSVYWAQPNGYYFIHIDLNGCEETGFCTAAHTSSLNNGSAYGSLVDSIWDNSRGGYYIKSKEHKPHYMFTTGWSRAGNGTSWVSELLPSGNRRLIGYRKHYPLVVLNLSSKWYYNYGTVTLADNVFNFTTSHSHTLNLPTSWTYSTSGTHYTSYNTSNNTWWYQLICNLYTETMQWTAVQVNQFGGGTDAVLKYIDLYAQPNYVNETIASNLSYAQSVHTIEGYSASLGAINMTVSPSGRGVGLTVDEAPMDYFENIYLSAIAGETVWMGGGAPLMEMQSAKDTEYEVTMKLKLYNETGALSSGQAYVMLSKNQFWDGLFRAADDILFDDTVTFDSNGNATLVIDGLTDVDKGKKVWYNLRAYTNGYYVECTECKVKVK